MAGIRRQGGVDRGFLTILLFALEVQFGSAPISSMVPGFFGNDGGFDRLLIRPTMCCIFIYGLHLVEAQQEWVCRSWLR